MQLGADSVRSFLEDMPKVELHLHIEGSFQPELIFTIARRNGLDVKIERKSDGSRDSQRDLEKLRAKAQAIGARVQENGPNDIAVLFDTPEQLKQAYSFDNLQEFLDIYYAGMNVLQTEQDFYDLTMAYLEVCDAQNIVHTEIFFDPQGHTSRGVAFDDVINGIHRALRDGEECFGITSGLILSFLRHLSAEDAYETWRQAQPHLDKIIGVGLDSSEYGHPPSKFSRLYDVIRPSGLRLMAHAGEEGPPSYVREALDILGVHRIDHGNRSMEDRALVKRLATDGMCLTVCPLSNLYLKGVQDMREHPLLTMLGRGLKVTVNSDDPAYFGGYMNENFLALRDALGMTPQQAYTLTRNAIEGSFATPERKAEILQALDDHMWNCGHDMPGPDEQGPDSGPG